MENYAKLMEILRGLDDSEAPEWPADYNGAELAVSLCRDPGRASRASRTFSRSRYVGPTLMPFCGSALLPACVRS